ncbi:MAG: thiamine phosphate synthase [Planctomycetes bacterium]|nr:thiamine phosphate synthase [Planctomycetota bacterium]
MPRILDANLNRAREASRVCEEWVRFAWNDAGRARRWRALRHAIARAAVDWPGGHAALARSRDVTRDVGPVNSRRVSAPRVIPADVFRANAARLTEALRACEEYSKTVSSRLASRFERLRFEGYALEADVRSRLEARRRRLDQARLTVLLSSSIALEPLDRLVRRIARAGAEVIQLREKGRPDAAWARLAARLARIAHDSGALFIVNDRADIAVASGADGVHGGGTDLPTRVLREVVGPERLVGATSHRWTEAVAAQEEGADYVSVGPVFDSALKPRLRAVGLGYVRRAAAARKAGRLRIPFVAIGGITPENARAVRRAGATHLAVCRAVCAAASPSGVVSELR